MTMNLLCICMELALKDFNQCWAGNEFLRFLSTGSGISVPVPTARYQGFRTRVSGDNLDFSHFGISSVTFWYHFGSKSGGA